jgi:hypothetical protein
LIVLRGYRRDLRLGKTSGRILEDELIIRETELHTETPF